MQHERTRDINVLHICYTEEDRYLKPTRAAIDAMKKSLDTIGQISPIGVSPVSLQTYRLIVGATRFLAAKELGWKTIRASIWSGTGGEYRMHELEENLERRSLTGKQRREMKAEIRRLQAEHMVHIEPGRGGRGNKGGVREEARQMGVPETTARRRKGEEKPRQTPQGGAVSDRTRPLIYGHKVSVKLPQRDWDRFQAWQKRQKIVNTAEALRRLVSEFLDAEDDHREDVSDAAE